jgi:hypothetical protein
MADAHPSPHGRNGLALFCLSFLTAACSADRNVVAIIDEVAGGTGGVTSESHSAGAINPNGGATTNANGGARERATSNVNGGSPVGSMTSAAANGGTPSGGMSIATTSEGGAAIESTARAMNEGGGGTTNTATISGGTNPANGGTAAFGAAGNATTGGVPAIGGSLGTQDLGRAGVSTLPASGAPQGGASAQPTDFSVAGSNHLGTLIFSPDPGAPSNSTDSCLCVPPNGPLLCSQENTTDYPVCGESCASEAPACIGRCPCRQSESISITFEGIECLGHDECGPNSACLMAEDTNTHELIASHCL